MSDCFMWPVPGFERVSSGFGYRRDPITGVQRFHRGIDISRDLQPPRAILGAEIVAVADGTVVGVGYSPSMGFWVKVEHCAGLSTRYMHNAINLVNRGQYVRQGDVIASVGSTGRSTGPHLHFEVIVYGTHQDPLLFVCPSRQEAASRISVMVLPAQDGVIAFPIAGMCPSDDTFRSSV